jgi:hypothetical protein
MTALYYEALRCLPECFVDDATLTADFGDCIVAVNPALHPIIYERGVGWKQVIAQPPVAD